jgi:hypothetical protein
MASFVNFSVQTREALKNYILTALGAPLITIELHDTQLEQCIDDAVELFSKWITYDKDFLGLNLENYVENIGFTLPDNVVDICTFDDDLMPGGGVSTLFSLPNQMYQYGLWPSFKGGASWVDFHMAMSFVDMCKKMTGNGFRWNYNVRNKILKLHPDPIKDKITGYIVTGVYVMRPETQQYGENWIKRYATACAKEILGRVRTKFQGVQLLGGGTIDTSVLEEGKAEKVTLLEELKGESGPAMFYVM